MIDIEAGEAPASLAPTPIRASASVTAEVAMPLKNVRPLQIATHDARRPVRRPRSTTSPHGMPDIESEIAKARPVNNPSPHSLAPNSASIGSPRTDREVGTNV